MTERKTLETVFVSAMGRNSEGSLSLGDLGRSLMKAAAHQRRLEGR